MFVEPVVCVRGEAILCFSVVKGLVSFNCLNFSFLSLCACLCTGLCVDLRIT